MAPPPTPFDGKILDREFEVSAYLKDFEKFPRDEKFSDVVFVVADQKFYGHKSIITARCPYLGRILSDDVQSVQEIKVENISPDDFSSVLSYLYSDDVTLTPRNVVDIHHIAVLYELTRLRQITEVFIRDNIALDNVLTMLKAANRRKEANIERFCFSFFANNETFTKIIADKETTELATTNGALYIQISQVLAKPKEDLAHTLTNVTVDESTFRAEMLGLLNAGTHADTRIKTADGGELYAHRVVLLARCPNMLTGGSLHKTPNPNPHKVETLSFPGLERTVVYTMLRYIYSNRIIIENLNQTYGLIELADIVQQDSIINVCNEMMRQNLSGANAIKTLMISSKYQLLSLKAATLGTLVKEASTVCVRKDLRTVLAESPNDMIDIIRALVKGADAQYSDEEEDGSDGSDDDESGDELK